MQIKVKGVVLKEFPISEKTRILTILTTEYGLIRAFSNKNFKKETKAASSIFCYSEFLIYKKAEKYIINHAEKIEFFWKLRENIEKLSLAQYFCELTLNLLEESEQPPEILRLILNCFYFICEAKIPMNLLKAVFELRLSALAGYMPDFVACDECHNGKIEQAYFILRKSKIICQNCYLKNNYYGDIKIEEEILQALRYIVYSEFSKLFKINIKKENINTLSNITEKYTKKYLNHELVTLNFYNKIIDNC